MLKSEIETKSWKPDNNGQMRLLSDKQNVLNQK